MDVIVDGQGPITTECDTVEIEAESKWDAIALGVQWMLTHRYPDGQRYQYCQDQRADGASPYTGVRALVVEDEPTTGGWG